MPRLSADEASLLAAICAASADDLPRLVYADWLEEHGRGARAEFIRVQVQLPLAVRGSERTALERRAAELRGEHGAEWLRELPKWARPQGGWEVEYPRGFLSDIALRATDFVTWGESFLKQHPVETATLTEAANMARRLAKCTALGRLTGLTFRWEKFGDAEVAKLAASPHVAGLRELTFFGCEVGDEAARALSRSPHLRSLEKLTIAYSDVTDHGAAHLIRSPSMPQLRLLDLCIHAVARPPARALVQQAAARGLTVLWPRVEGEE